MLNNKTLFLAGAGLAIYAAYKYSKMTEEQKNDLMNSLKEKGKVLVDRLVPEDIKTKFNNAAEAAESSFKTGF